MPCEGRPEERTERTGKYLKTRQLKQATTDHISHKTRSCGFRLGQDLPKPEGGLEKVTEAGQWKTVNSLNFPKEFQGPFKKLMR